MRIHPGYEISMLTMLRIGDVVYLKALSREMLVVNSAEAAYEILDKNSSLTSDRPQNIMISLCVSMTL